VCICEEVIYSNGDDDDAPFSGLIYGLFCSIVQDIWLCLGLPHTSQIHLYALLLELLHDSYPYPAIFVILDLQILVRDRLKTVEYESFWTKLSFGDSFFALRIGVTLTRVSEIAIWFGTTLTQT
jgi:hypothetical protein